MLKWTLAFKQHRYLKNSERYNLRRRPECFVEGDMVLKKNFPQSDATNFFSAKLAPKYTGPYVISKKVSPLTYQLKGADGTSIGIWHVCDLKRYTA